MAKRHTFKKTKPGEGRVDVVARPCMVVDWCIDHPEYTAKIKVIPKKDHPVLIPCASSEVYFCKRRDRNVALLHGDVVLRIPLGCRFAPFELLRIYGFTGVVGI